MAFVQVRARMRELHLYMLCERMCVMWICDGMYTCTDTDAQGLAAAEAVSNQLVCVYVYALMWVVGNMASYSRAHNKGYAQLLAADE